MKKFTALLFFLFLTLPFFSQSYKISDAQFSIKGAGFKFLGTTKEYSVLSNYPLDKKTVFKTEEELNTYIKNYKSQLESSRIFDSVQIDYETAASDDISEVTLLIKLEDSHHLVFMPYPKYSSNDGLSLKLKAKDTNFLGTMNTMNAEFKMNYSNKGFKPGFSFSFDYPFHIGPFHAEFLNDYTLTYVISDDKSGFEWQTKTGLKFSLPFDRLKLEFGAIQYTNEDFKYIKYKDDLYFTENFFVALPVTLTTFSNFSHLIYKPEVSLNCNWDFDSINKENDDLSSPDLTFTHSLSNEKILWEHNFRKGYSFEVKNAYMYNFQRNDFVPSLAFSGKYFNYFTTNDQDYWNRVGIATSLYAFGYFDIPDNKYFYGDTVGDKIRGVLDENYFGNTKPYGTSSAAIILNIDLPNNVCTTTFSKEILNFNLQFSPFFDVAFVYDRETNRAFHPADAFYCAGFEFLVYPLKWSSITVRASLGIDLKKSIQEENNFLEAISHNNEVFIGIGLLY